MTDRELKEMLSRAYTVPETARSRQFLIKYEKRSLQWKEVLMIEFSHMGLQSILKGILVCALLFGLCRVSDKQVIGIVSLFIPFFPFVPMLQLGHSERFRMAELEAASRFSLKFVRLVRMLFLSVFSSVIVIACGFILGNIYSMPLTDILISILLPYLGSLWGGIVFTRKRHGKDCVPGIAAICAVSGLIAFCFRNLQNVLLLSEYFYILLCAGLLVMIVKESVTYLKESENVLWNLCWTE